jgi:predicted RNA-binding Zn-ribbon protein involved in translation (DUF1610 family)
MGSMVMLRMWVLRWQTPDAILPGLWRTYVWKGEMMDDLIWRTDVVNYIEEYGIIDGYEDTQNCIRGIKALPSAQPEPKKGQWIKVNGHTLINCSACHHSRWSLSFENTVKEFNFCPNCGAKMLKDGEG